MTTSKRRTLIAAAWNQYEAACVPIMAGETQRRETRQAFYGGIAVLFEMLMKGLDDGSEATDGDLALLDDLHAELREFGQELDRRALAQMPAFNKLQS